MRNLCLFRRAASQSLCLALEFVLHAQAHTGNIPFPSFAAWADDGGMSEEQLNHAEVLGSSAERCVGLEHKRLTVVSCLDCYWVGSLDFNFVRNQGVFH